MTYISLFSSAGIGCYGFKEAGFECIATNELIPRRLDIQRHNRKCKYESGYICGDITLDETKSLLRDEISMWERREKLKRVDVVIATPPCQGMSVANHKKKDTEIIRNSLVIESIKIIREIRPKFFVFENVPAFMKTICTDVDGVDKPISEAIESNLGKEYSYAARIINFKNYGACSSRQRTVVIGVSNEYADEVSPFELFPDLIPERTLREVIGHLPALTNFGEICEDDIFHAFRPYPEHMRAWISGLAEGQSAFDNDDDTKKPHQIVDGKLVVNQNKNGDKYRRQIWDKVGPCVHTRNDQLASQNTIHPKDDRVFSIRELMLMMTVPREFRWTDDDLESLNQLSFEEKRIFLKHEEIKIRQSLGEAVPTAIFKAIAKKIASVLSRPRLTNATVTRIVQQYDFSTADKIIEFIDNNPEDLSLAALSRIAELVNTNRTEDAAFYTNKALITEMIKLLPDTDSDSISILEPSVGVGNFIPLIAKKFEGKKIRFDLVDIDENSIRIAMALMAKYGQPKNCEFNYINDDFLTYQFERQYDYVIGNPPFYKMSSTDKMLKVYRDAAINKQTTNICSFFLDKVQALGKQIAVVFPKFILNTPEFRVTRDYLSQKAVPAIIDFGEKGFPGVLIETIALFIDNTKKPKNTIIRSATDRIEMLQRQSYIFDKALPYWIIYRDADFDSVKDQLDLGVFDVFRDRQLTNSYFSNNACDIRVIKARNISNDGSEIVNIEGYDSYIAEERARGLGVYRFLNAENVYLTPNMTYYPRVMKKPKNTLVNGSVAILIPKDGFELTEDQMRFFSTDEYRKFYWVARNHQTRSLNVDSCSVYFFGVKKAK